LRKAACIVVVSCSLVCSAVSERLANASYEKPKSPPRPAGPTKQKPKIKVLKRLNMKVTAYYGPKPGQIKYAHGSLRKDIRVNGAGKETRSGTVPKIGTAAADWRVLRRGVKFRVVDCDDVMLGEKNLKPVSDIIFTVEDTGGGVKGNHVDIFTGFGNEGCETAVNFGSRRYVIEVVDYVLSQ
jgi:3D (Asp-Asp-Asp) domain-containing protein